MSRPLECRVYPYCGYFFRKKRFMKRIFPVHCHELGRAPAARLGDFRHRTSLRRPVGDKAAAGGLLVFAAIFGFGGALISLALSKWTAKRLMGVRVIAAPQTDLEAWLLGTVQRLATQAHIATPEVGIFDAEEMNAFATGARRNAALVAVSSGLLRGMPRPQAEAVLGHEISHVANGDMVTLALLPRCAEHLCDISRANHRRHRRQGDFQEPTGRVRHGLF